MAKGEFGFVQGGARVEKPLTWKKGSFTFSEKIVPGVVHLYNCKYENGDVSNTAPTVQSTPRLAVGSRKQVRRFCGRPSGLASTPIHFADFWHKFGILVPHSCDSCVSIGTRFQ